ETTASGTLSLHDALPIWAREAAVKHVCDSLTCLLAGQWPRGGAVCDLGSGGGFPGMVVALARPDLRVRLVDAAGKKVAFLASVRSEEHTSELQSRENLVC